MMNPESKLTDNPLAISWHDSAWIPILNPHNVMDYFSERSNPFYDRTCNNEVLKMQRASPEQLQNMQGVEYCLLHVQEPILYVIRKQQRISTTHVTPISDYYIIAGTVYQAPDLGSVLNSRLLTTVTHLQSAFEEARQFSRYHPSKGYWWDFGKKDSSSSSSSGVGTDKGKDVRRKKRRSKKSENERKAKEEPSSLFQRRRVDMLLDLLTRKFPPKVTPPAAAAAPSAPSAATAASAPAAGQDKDAEKDGSVSVKSEKVEAAATSSASLGVKREASSSRRPEAKKSKMS